MLTVNQPAPQTKPGASQARMYLAAKALICSLILLRLLRSASANMIAVDTITIGVYSALNHINYTGQTYNPYSWRATHNLTAVVALTMAGVHVPIGKGKTDRLSPKTTTGVTTLKLKKVDNAAAAVAYADGVKKAKSHNCMSSIGEAA